MAKTLPIRLEATILDEMNVKAETSVYALVDPTAAFSDVISTLNTWLADLDACTDGQIIGVELEVLPALPGGLKGAPVSGSRVAQTGLLNFTASGGAHNWAASIPALSNSSTVILAGRPVTTGGSPIHTLYALLTGGGTTALEWTNAWSQVLASFVSALLSFRDSGGQLARITYERA
jgi:hypothetical protein